MLFVCPLPLPTYPTSRPSSCKRYRHLHPSGLLHPSTSRMRCSGGVQMGFAVSYARTRRGVESGQVVSLIAGPGRYDDHGDRYGPVSLTCGGDRCCSGGLPRKIEVPDGELYTPEQRVDTPRCWPVQGETPRPAHCPRPPRRCSPPFLPSSLPSPVRRPSSIHRDVQTIMSPRGP